MARDLRDSQVQAEGSQQVVVELRRENLAICDRLRSKERAFAKDMEQLLKVCSRKQNFHIHVSSIN